MLSLTRAAFFVAPGVVALDQISGDTSDWLRANPLTGLFEAFRSVFLYGESPAAWELLVPCAFAPRHARAVRAAVPARGAPVREARGVSG